MLGTLFLVCCAILMGSIPTGVLVSRLLTGRDVRELGSGNFGAANVARTAGMKVGLLVALIDILKGVIPVVLGRWIGLDHPQLALVAVAAVLGHDFSMFLRLRGGKGVATTVGIALALSPLAALLAAVTWIVVILTFGYSSLASLVSLALLPLYLAITGQPSAYVLAASSLFLIGAAKHWENIIRLAHGKESKFRSRRQPPRGV